jgi:hypothetical protein
MKDQKTDNIFFSLVFLDSILIGSNTILEGDSSAVVKLADHAGWDAMKPLIRQKSNSGNSENNVTQTQRLISTQILSLQI